MTKPRLPKVLERQLPPEVLHLIYGFVPPLPKPKVPSPNLQRELTRLQHGTKTTAMYLKDLDDFILK
jgi:hypothetical protein